MTNTNERPRKPRYCLQSVHFRNGYEEVVKSRGLTRLNAEYGVANGEKGVILYECGRLFGIYVMNNEPHNVDTFLNTKFRDGKRRISNQALSSFVRASLEGYV